MLSKEYRQRLAKEYRYAVTKMQEAKDPGRKLYYFSVLFGEAQRTLNWGWNRDLVLIYTVTLHVHTQVNGAMRMPTGQILPIDWASLLEKLTQGSSYLAAYFERAENESSKEELYQILADFAVIAYAVSGNGSYLLERGAFKL